MAVSIALIGLTYRYRFRTPRKTDDYRILIVVLSLEEVGIGKSPGFVSILDTKHFYVNPKSTDPPDTGTERVVAKVYADVSLGYDDTLGRLGSDDHYQIENLGDKWAYNVSD